MSSFKTLISIARGKPLSSISSSSWNIPQAHSTNRTRVKYHLCMSWFGPAERHQALSKQTLVWFRFGCPFSYKTVAQGSSLIVTLFLHNERNIKMAHTTAHLDARVILVVTVLTVVLFPWDLLQASLRSFTVLKFTFKRLHSSTRSFIALTFQTVLTMSCCLETNSK